MKTAALFFLMGFSVAVAAFCAGVETGFLSVPRVRLLSLVRQSAPRAKCIAERQMGKILGELGKRN